MRYRAHIVIFVAIAALTVGCIGGITEENYDDLDIEMASGEVQAPPLPVFTEEHNTTLTWTHVRLMPNENIIDGQNCLWLFFPEEGVMPEGATVTGVEMFAEWEGDALRDVNTLEVVVDAPFTDHPREMAHSDWHRSPAHVTLDGWNRTMEEFYPYAIFVFLVPGTVPHGGSYAVDLSVDVWASVSLEMTHAGAESLEEIEWRDGVCT